MSTSKDDLEAPPKSTRKRVVSSEFVNPRNALKRRETRDSLVEIGEYVEPTPKIIFDDEAAKSKGRSADDDNSESLSKANEGFSLKKQIYSRWNAIFRIKRDRRAESLDDMGLMERNQKLEQEIVTIKSRFTCSVIGLVLFFVIVVVAVAASGSSDNGGTAGNSGSGQSTEVPTPEPIGSPQPTVSTTPAPAGSEQPSVSPTQEPFAAPTVSPTTVEDQIELGPGEFLVPIDGQVLFGTPRGEFVQVSDPSGEQLRMVYGCGSQDVVCLGAMFGNGVVGTLGDCSVCAPEDTDVPLSLQVIDRPSNWVFTSLGVYTETSADEVSDDVSVMGLILTDEILISLGATNQNNLFAYAQNDPEGLLEFRGFFGTQDNSVITSLGFIFRYTEE